LRVKRLSIALMLLLLAPLSGCGSSGGVMTMQGWRDTVERYIDTEGQGDPNALRNVTWPESRREFSVIGGEVPSQSQDANGVLLGVPQVGNARWYVFLVGTVDKGVVNDIRLMALNSNAGRRTWRVGSANSAALQSYRNYYDKLWRSRFPGRNSAPMEYTTFPKESDSFTVSVNGGTITATHAPSGAAWTVAVSAR
jgi:hypothetical protein